MERGKGRGSRAGAAAGRAAPIAGPIIGLFIGLVGSACSDPGPPGTGSERAGLELQPEQDVGPTTPVLAAGSQSTVGPLRAGDHYLVAWIDTRRAWPDPLGTGRDLMAARVTDDGTVLDPVGFPIASNGPALLLTTGSGACNEQGLCLFVTGVSTGFVGPLTGIRVVGDQVLDPTPFAIADGVSLASSRAVAWDGQQFRVVYSRSGAVESVAVSEDGQVGSPVDVGLQSFEPVFECAGTRCLVAVSAGDFSNPTSVGRMVDPSGPSGPSFVISDPPGQPSSPSMFWDGARFWLGYNEAGMQGQRIYLVRVTVDGLVVDPAGLTVYTAPPITSVVRGSLAPGDGGVIMSWQRSVAFPVDESVRLTRVRADGVVLDPEGVVVGVPPMRALALACGPDTCLGTSNEGFTDVRGYRFDGTTLLDPAGIDISTAPAGQAEPAAAAGAGRYAAVWRDDRPAIPLPSLDSIHGVLFPPTMDSFVSFETGFIGCGDQRDPRVALSSTSVMAVWHEDCPPSHRVDDSYAQAFGLDGAPLGPPIDIGNRNGRDSHPTVVSDGSDFVVLWDYEEPDPPRALRMRRYSASGAALTDRLLFNRNGTSPAAVFDGTNYLVVWQRPLSTEESRPDLFAARMAPDGTVLDADIPIATLPNIPEGAHSVACGGGVCLVAWRHAAIQVRALRLGLDGTVLDPAPLTIAVDGPVRVTSMTYDGEAFLLGWQEESGEVRAVQVTPAGEIVAPGPFQVAPASLRATHPVMVSNGAGHRIAMVERYDASPTTLMRRIRARVVGEPAPGPDAGAPDAGVPDAAVPDAAPPDASPPDAAPTGDPDYVVAALGDPPAAAVSGATFSVDVTVHNAGGPASATSTTRFYLSVDTAIGGDRTLTRTATVPPLGAGASDAQTVPLAVPTGLASGSYFLLACADRGATVPESDDRNNCRASASAVAVTGPDLVVDSVADPPPALVVGQSFPASDTTRNAGTAAASSSSVAYYLSPTPVKGAGARRLSTTRSTGPIPMGGVSSGAAAEKVPSVAPGAYYLIACADVSSTVAELVETNNCAAAAGTTTIAASAP